jgi:PAT family acetyl-CoA transporter-like MFS transporter 1
MALESYNILTLSDFLYFWGIVFMVATTLVAIFKHEDQRKEKDEESTDEDDGEEILGVVDTYKQLVSFCNPLNWPGFSPK